jgi:hypothetical protein
MLSLRRAVLACGMAGALATGGALGGLALSAGGTAAAQPTSPSTASFSFNLSVGSSGGTSTLLSGSGAADFAADQASLAVNLPPSFAADLPGGSSTSTPLDVVVSGGTVYLSYPGLTSLTGGKPWVSISLPSKVQAVVPKAFSAVSSVLGDVSGLVTAAQKAHLSVTSLGSKEINGVSATGSEISVRLRHLSRWAKKSRALKKFDHAVHKLPADFVPTTTTRTGRVVVDLWANGSNQLVQASARITLRRAVTADFQIDFTGYGSPVSITVPSSSETLAVPLSLVLKYVAAPHVSGSSGYKVLPGM